MTDPRCVCAGPSMRSCPVHHGNGEEISVAAEPPVVEEHESLFPDLSREQLEAALATLELDAEFVERLSRGLRPGTVGWLADKLGIKEETADRSLTPGEAQEHMSNRDERLARIRGEVGHAKGTKWPRGDSWIRGYAEDCGWLLAELELAESALHDLMAKVHAADPVPGEAVPDLGPFSEPAVEDVGKGFDSLV